MCCAVLCCAALWCNVVCCATLWCNVVCSVQCCGVVWCGVVWCAVVCCALQCFVVLCSVAPCCCAVLCCAVLCCAVLCCAVLYPAAQPAVQRRSGVRISTRCFKPRGYHVSPLTMAVSLLQETRYRQRYLDLIVNVTTCNTFITGSKIISFLRKFLDNRHFLEVCTRPRLPHRPCTSPQEFFLGGYWCAFGFLTMIMPGSSNLFMWQWGYPPPYRRHSVSMPWCGCRSSSCFHGERWRHTLWHAHVPCG
jgi:hypothetical protein